MVHPGGKPWLWDWLGARNRVHQEAEIDLAGNQDGLFLQGLLLSYLLPLARVYLLNTQNFPKKCYHLRIKC